VARARPGPAASPSCSALPPGSEIVSVWSPSVREDCAGPTGHVESSGRSPAATPACGRRRPACSYLSERETGRSKAAEGVIRVRNVEIAVAETDVEREIRVGVFFQQVGGRRVGSRPIIGLETDGQAELAVDEDPNP